MCMSYVYIQLFVSVGFGIFVFVCVSWKCFLVNTFVWNFRFSSRSLLSCVYVTITVYAYVYVYIIIYIYMCVYINVWLVGESLDKSPNLRYRFWWLRVFFLCSGVCITGKKRKWFFFFIFEFVNRFFGNSLSQTFSVFRVSGTGGAKLKIESCHFPTTQTSKPFSFLHFMLRGAPRRAANTILHLFVFLSQYLFLIAIVYTHTHGLAT